MSCSCLLSNDNLKQAEWLKTELPRYHGRPRQCSSAEPSLLLLALHVRLGPLETPLELPETVGVTHLSPTGVAVIQKSQLCRTLPHGPGRKGGDAGLLSRIEQDLAQEAAGRQQGAVADGVAQGMDTLLYCHLQSPRGPQGNQAGERKQPGSAQVFLSPYPFPPAVGKTRTCPVVD